MTSGLGIRPARRKVAPPLFPSSSAVEQSNVDLAGEFTNLIQARVAYGFAVAVLRTADEMLRALLDIRA